MNEKSQRPTDSAGTSRAAFTDATGRLRPDDALSALMEGNHRFSSGAPRHRLDLDDALQHAHDPRPWALVIGCMDSRVPPEAVFDQGFGDLFVVRTAGHVLDRVAAASVELAVGAMRVPLVVVLGHESCAAVRYAVGATLRGEKPDGALGFMVDRVAPSVPSDTSLPETDACEETARGNVRSVVAELTGMPTVSRAVAAGDLAVVGIRYTVTDGRAEVIVAPR